MRPEDVGRYAHEVILLAWKRELKTRLELLRLLPAGAVAGWALHPLESAALSRRTPKADIRYHEIIPFTRLTSGINSFFSAYSHR